MAATCVTDSSAFGATEDFKKEIKNYLDPKQVAVICTDGAAYYTGSNNGMIAQLKNDIDFDDKFIYLPDVCHKIPSWVLDFINTKNIVNTILKVYLRYSFC